VTAEPNWLRRFIIANLDLWERGNRRGATVADIATATGYPPRSITAELELMQADGLAVQVGSRWHPPPPVRPEGEEP
jgi:DNA-binding IclR family transcriptional regulator